MSKYFGMALVVGCVWLGGAGCAVREYATGFDPKAPEPAPDAASVTRAFPPVSAEYENTAVVAWRTRTALVVAPGTSDLARPVLEPAIFVANVALMPLALLAYPPFEDQVAYRVGGTESTFSGAPPFEAVVPAGRGAILPALSPAFIERVTSPSTDPDAVKGGKPEWRAIKPAPKARGTEAESVPTTNGAEVAPAMESQGVPAEKVVEPLPEATREQPLPVPGDRSPLAPSLEVTPVPALPTTRP